MKKISEKLSEEIYACSEKYYEDYLQIYKRVSKSKAVYKGEPVPFLYIPAFYTEKEIENFRKITNDIFRIVNKTIKLYLENNEIRKLFDFSTELEDLIMLEHNYKANVPMGRFDIFYYGKKCYKICELNTDGSSAMNEDYVLGKILNDSLIMKSINKNYNISPFELFDSWVNETEKIYKEWGGKKKNPFVAIVDFKGKSSPVEFEEFKLRFQKKGFRCEIVEPDQISEKDGFMFYKRDQIDIVYRRLVTGDMIRSYNNLKDFVKGILANRTCIIGPVKSQIVHNKKFFRVLHEKKFRKFLSDDECSFIDEHVPYTEKLIKEKFNLYIQKKNELLIKPEDLYASKGVAAGKDCSESEWIKLLENAADKNYLIQEYCIQPKKQNIFFNDEGKTEIQNLSRIIGLFVYNEKFQGLYSRASFRKSIISGIHNCYTLPSFQISSNIY